MSTVYSIKYTDTNEQPFVINPNQINGHSGYTSNSSLVLHGTGRLKYGEAINENFLHLLENFASPQRNTPIVTLIHTANDSGVVGTHYISIYEDLSNIFVNGYKFNIINSTGAVNDGVYTVNSSSFDQPSNSTIITLVELLPDAQAALLGEVQYEYIEPDPTMVHPPYVIGQLWFNKTDNKLYIYRDISNNNSAIYQWILSSSGGAFENKEEPPLYPVDGMLWYDITVPQLKVYYSGSWGSVADRYVLKSGDTMTGDIKLANQGTTTNRLVFNNSDNDETSIYVYEPAVGQSNLRLHLSDNTTQTDSDILDIGGYATGNGTTWYSVVQFTATGKINTEGLVTSNVLRTEIVDNKHLTTKEYVDYELGNVGSQFPNYVSKSGDTMSGNLEITGGGLSVTSYFAPYTADTAVANGGTYGIHVKTNAGLDTGGILIEAGDNNTDESAIRLVNFAGNLMFDLKATNGYIYSNGNTYYQNGGSLILDHNPTLVMEAATKGYVDTEIASAEANLQSQINNITGGDNLAAVNPITPEDGDIKVTGSGATLEIFIYGGAVWNKIFPAQYA